MAVKLGDELEYGTCQKIKTGVVFRLFDLNCTKTLARCDLPSPVFQKLPSEAQESTYISEESARQILICQPPGQLGFEDFAKKHTMLRMAARIRSKCPWFDHAGINVRVTVTYSEQTNPFNAESQTDVYNEVWTADSTFTQTYTSTIAGDPFTAAYGTTGQGQATITIAQADATPTNTCGTASSSSQGYLESTGIPWDTLLDARTQNDANNCASIIGDSTLFTWTAQAFPIGPIGLVMTMSVLVEFISFDN